MKALFLALFLLFTTVSVASAINNNDSTSCIKECYTMICYDSTSSPTLTVSPTGEFGLYKSESSRFGLVWDTDKILPWNMNLYVNTFYGGYYPILNKEWAFGISVGISKTFTVF